MLNNSKPIYNCYCSKYNTVCKEPYFNSNKIVIPHSCGLNCDKLICSHLKCTLPCHPGPHVQCDVITDLSCFCEKITKSVTCQSGLKEFSCGTVCGKTLSCELHACKQLCHEEDCDDFLEDKKYIKN